MREMKPIRLCKLTVAMLALCAHQHASLLQALNCSAVADALT
jgi:hypothetical protein